MIKSDDRPIDPSAIKPLATVRLDADLMNALTAADGKDNAALGELMIRHEGLVSNEIRRWNIRRGDVDEVAGEVWKQVWKIGRDHRWNVARARHVQDPFVPLLRRICRNKAMDFHRQATRDRVRLERLCTLAKSHGDDWQEKMASQPRRAPRAERPEPAGVPAQLAAAVAALPDQLRTVFELSAQGLSNRKIATQVGCSPSQAWKRLAAARDRLGLPRTNRPR